MDGYGDNDKQYLENPDQCTVFISEKDNRIIHYFLVFEDAINSPLVKTPIFNNMIKHDSAYLGSAFTSPDARGFWIMPYSISHIINYLKEATNQKYVIFLLHKNTPGAIQFYQKLGFKILEDVAPKGPIQWLLSKI